MYTDLEDWTALVRSCAGSPESGRADGNCAEQSQQYVWERGNMRTKLILNTGDVPEIIRSGSLDKAALQEGLGDSGTVIDLTGCSLENVLYEVSAQRAVIARTGADSSRSSWDMTNTHLPSESGYRRGGALWYE